MNTDCIVLFVTTPDFDGAKKIAKRLVEEKLAACVNIIPKLQSVYRWKGEVEEADEAMLFIKTTQAQFSKLEAWIQKHHSYTVPEIIALPIMEGSRNYLDWLKESVVA